MEHELPTVTINNAPQFVKAKEFNSGSRGYYVWGKVLIDGKKYQVICNLVEVGSKPKTA